MKKYYLSVAVNISPYDQGDELYLLKIGNCIAGLSTEFELWTFDIGKAASIETYQDVVWQSWDSQLTLNPATLGELESFGLMTYVIGSRKGMKPSSPIDPLYPAPPL